jgi:2-keto-3-deoxy-L-rhamnonate aldolase RhmA
MARLKEALRAGKTVTLVNPGFPSPQLVEFLGEAGFDAVMLDCEHSPASIERIDEMARAARASGIASIVRPEIAHEAIITRYLDCRIDGIMVPHVHDAAEAKRIVEIVRYARPKAHQETVIIGMLESTEAFDNLDSILKVDGIDVFFIGRGDLSKTMGHGGNKSHPEVVAVVDKASQKIQQAGRVVGGAGDWDDVATVIQKGMRLIYIPAKMLLTQGARNYLARAGLAKENK